MKGVLGESGTRGSLYIYVPLGTTNMHSMQSPSAASGTLSGQLTTDRVPHLPFPRHSLALRVGQLVIPRSWRRGEVRPGSLSLLTCEPGSQVLQPHVVLTTMPNAVSVWTLI